MISTGGSVIEVVDALRAVNANVLGVVSIFTYNLAKGLERLKASNVINHSLSSFEVLASVAHKNHYITEVEYKR